jgi:hypothetical protein
MSLFKTASKRIPSLTDMVGDMAVKKARKVTVPIDIQEAEGFEIYQKVNMLGYFLINSSPSTSCF